MHQVLDQEEEIAMAEFAKFEQKLEQQKGERAADESEKNSIDSVPS
jgi:hypothetical protein